MSLQPADLALATDGTLYVVDRTAARVVHLDANGAILREWGRVGDGPGEFREPSTIALGENGSVYVGDRRGRITVFSRTGEIQGTISSQPIRDIADLVVLSNGTLIVAADVRLGEGPRLSEESGAYVALIDSTGSTIKHVLSVSRPEAGVERPLLGHAINRVRLSSGPDDTFAVWYPLDNYVEVFEGTGDELWTMSGCLPETIRSAYARQARGDPGRQSSVPLTLGVDFAADSELRVASFYISADNAKVLRVRRYPKNRGEMAARDFDVSDRPFLYRVVFLSDSTFLTFNATSPDLGIHEFTMR